MLPTIAIRRTRPGVKDLEQKYLPRNGWIFLKHGQSFWESYLVLVLINLAAIYCKSSNQFNSEEDARFRQLPMVHPSDKILIFCFIFTNLQLEKQPKYGNFHGKYLFQ